MEDLIPQISARDLALILFKRKWSIVLVILGTMLAFFAWLFLIHDDIYVVSSKVLVKIGREQAPPPSVMGATPLVIAYRSQDVNSEIDIFQSTDSIAKVVDEFHLDQPVPEPVPVGLLARSKYAVKHAMKSVKDWYEEMMIRVGLRDRLTPREKVIYGLKLGLQVRAQKDSNVFVAELALPNRVGAARVLNRLVDHYLELRQQVFHVKELGFFETAASGASADLENAETRLQNFEVAGGISELDKQEGILLEHIAAARAAWKEADYARQEFAGRITRLEEELKKPDPNLAAVSEFGHEGFQQNVINQLAELQRDREKLRMTELDTGDRIQNNRQQFRALAEMLSANVRTALEEKEQQTNLRRAAYDTLQNQLQQLHSKSMQWADLKRKARDQENTYLVYRKKLEEASADGAMQQLRIGNVAVIERATDPLAPAGMRKTMLLGLALVAAFLAALVWVTIAEFFDHRVYTVEQLQRQITIPVFAAIPEGTRLEADFAHRKSNERSRFTHVTPQ